jgi:DNA-binding GntR family transcriptional regulator
MYDKRSPFLATAAPPGADLQRTGALSRLRDAIVSCELPPGVRVSEAGLSRRFGFGKAAVRAALSRLETSGLVAAEPRSGWVVTPVTGAELAAVVTARRVAEACLVPLPPGAGAAAPLAACAAVADAMAAAGDRPGALRAERQWRNRLAGLLDNAILQRWLTETWDRAERIGNALEVPLSVMAPGGRTALNAAFAAGGGTALVRAFDAATTAFEAEAAIRLLRHARLMPGGCAPARATAGRHDDGAPRAATTDQKPTRQGGADR